MAMPSIKLKPEEGDLINVPTGKTVIGRGAFLNVVDKRVSRNHGILEVDDGKLYLTPTHSNPCFLKKDGGMTPMTKDQKKLMEDGEIFGLLRDKLYFTVMYDVPNGTMKSEEKDTSKETSKQNGEDNSKQSKKPSKVKSEEKEEESSMSEKRRVLPSWMIEMARDSVPKSSNKPSSKRTAPVKKKKAESEDDWMEEESEEEVKPKGKGRRGNSAKTENAKRVGKKSKYAESSEEEEEESEESEEEIKPKKARQRRQSSEDENMKPKKRKKGRGRKQSDDEQSTSWRGRPSRSAACKRGSYGTVSMSTSSQLQIPEYLYPQKIHASRFVNGTFDDFVAPDDMSEEEEDEDSDKDQDSDFHLDSLEDSGSDWEMSQKSKKQKPVRQGTRKSARQGRRKRYTSDFSDEEDEEYVPRPTKRRASMSANKKFKSYRRDEDSEEDSEDERPSKKSPKKGRGRPAKGRRRKDESESEEEEESEEEDEVKKKGRKKKMTSSEEEEESEEEKPKKKKSKDQSESDDSEKDTPSKKQKKDAKEGGKKKRKPCQFGKKCYRKNPIHFKDYCHPGDESYEASDEDKPECQYGTDCYRTNPEHLREFKHTVTLSLPSAKKAKRSVLSKDHDDDDGQPNTYDYNDSFIDDDIGSESSGSYEDPENSDSDYDPEDSQSVKNLQKEARKFIKNKKMQRK